MTYTTTVQDTGERREYFGLAARHLRTSIETRPSSDSCDSLPLKVEIDGWYIDLDESGFECQSDSLNVKAALVPLSGECENEIRFEGSGPANRGFPVLRVTTFYTPGGNSIVQREEVVELSRATLSAALFDIPTDYSQVATFQELAEPLRQK